MANIPIKDGNLADRFTSATGAGTNLDPFVPNMVEGNSATIATNTGTIATNTGTAATNSGNTATRIGATDETSAASDTATSGLNGLIKRLLARMTTLFTILPVSRGQKNLHDDALCVTPPLVMLGASVGEAEALAVTVRNATAMPVDDADTQVILNAAIRTDGQNLTGIRGIVPAYIDDVVANATELTSLNYPLPVRVNGYTVPISRQVSFVRPANTTQYTAGDVVAGNGVTAMNEVATVFPVTGQHAVLRAIHAFKSTNTTVNSAFRVHLFRYNSGLTVAADNAAIVFDSTFLTGSPVWFRLGHVDIVFESAGSSTTAYSFVDGLDMDIWSGTGNTSLGFIVTALQAYTPGSAESFGFQFFIERSVPA